MNTSEDTLQVDIQKPSDYEVRLSVQVPVSQVDLELNKAYQKLSKRARIKGFRPGKIPRPILESYFREEAEAEAIQRIVESAYSSALKTHQIQPSSRPKIETRQLERGKPLSFQATFEVLPQIEAKGYRNLRVRKPTVEVTDENVKEQLERIRKTQMQLQVTEEDRPVKTGDFVLIKYSTAFPETTQNSKEQIATIEVGAGRFLPEVETALLGMKRGEEKTIPVIFPPNHPQKGLAGKEAVFTVKIQEIKEAVLPELNDDFARSVSTYQSLAELTAAVREGLEKEAREKEERELEERLLEALRDLNPVAIPPNTISERASMLLTLMQENLAQRGMKLNLEGEEGKQIWEKFRKEAEKEIHNEILISAIARQEKLEPGEDQIQEKLDFVKSHYTSKVPPKGAPQFDLERQRKQICWNLTRNAVIAFLRGSAKIEV